MTEQDITNFSTDLGEVLHNHAEVIAMLMTGTLEPRDWTVIGQHLACELVRQNWEVRRSVHALPILAEVDH